MIGAIGKKDVMLSYYNKFGKHIPVTKVLVFNYVVLGVKNKLNDGYNSVQIGYGKFNSKINLPLLGFFKKLGINPTEKITEFRYTNKLSNDIYVGKILKFWDIFSLNDVINVKCRSKGKGFQGVVKRYNFSGVGGQTHGQHNRQRSPGSIGAGSTPSRVWKGTKMAGRTGNNIVIVKRLKIVKIDKKYKYIFISGSIPGIRGNYIKIYHENKNI